MLDKGLGSMKVVMKEYWTGFQLVDRLDRRMEYVMAQMQAGELAEQMVDNLGELMVDKMVDKMENALVRNLDGLMVVWMVYGWSPADGWVQLLLVGPGKQLGFQTNQETTSLSLSLSLSSGM